MATRTPKPPLQVESHKHDDATRKNIPTAECQSIMREEDKTPIRVAYERRNQDLDPQLVWRGKDVRDWSDLVVHAPPLYIQEKVHPRVLIDDLKRQTDATKAQAAPSQQGFMADMFADFNGLPNENAKTEFYQHDAHWANRMILGDSLSVMASLAEREGLRGKVQCIYFDPPYGIKFNSNFQWSTTSRDVKDGNTSHITREPEQVKAFRDTWRDGIHSYLSYLRDRLTVARDLLTESGSIFVQIGDENVHRVRALMDEVFGDENFVSEIFVSKTGGQASNFIGNVADIIIWYGKKKESTKFRPIYNEREERKEDDFSPDPIKSSGNPDGNDHPFFFEGKIYKTGINDHWKTHDVGMSRLIKAERITSLTNSIRYKRFFQDYPVKPMSNLWTDLGGATNMIYVVQTSTRMIERCILMATDPGDLVLDPTCGSGTTAYVAEQWGRRWITIDTSRVALALARARIMGARYPYYQLADKINNNLAHGFIYERVPHITLKSIANNTEIDVIWDKFQTILEPLRTQLNSELAKNWQEWEIPREYNLQWNDKAKKLHAQWWQERIARQKEIDASIAAKADFENLYDKPQEDKKKVRVAGAFTVESLSPHRILAVDENDEIIDGSQSKSTAAEMEVGQGTSVRDFAAIILENLRTAGVQQAHKQDRISFTALTPWPGNYVCAEGYYQEGETKKRAAIFIGPEFGTVSRPDLVSAAREAGDGGFDVLVACAFNYDAHSNEFDKLGRIPVLKARMNADLHMAEDLKNTGKGNLFVIFGAPDITILPSADDKDCIQVKVNGVDVFDPSTGEVRSDGADGIACWFVDTDYDEESFFVRHAYFLGANDPYKALKTTLKAEINQEAWDSLNSDTSRPFPKPHSGRIAVKVINHLGDEVMKVFKV